MMLAKEPSGEAGAGVVVMSLSDCKLAVGVAAVTIAIRRDTEGVNWHVPSPFVANS